MPRFQAIFIVKVRLDAADYTAAVKTAADFRRSIGIDSSFGKPQGISTDIADETMSVTMDQVFEVK